MALSGQREKKMTTYPTNQCWRCYSKRHFRPYHLNWIVIKSLGNKNLVIYNCSIPEEKNNANKDKKQLSWFGYEWKVQHCQHMLICEKSSDQTPHRSRFSQMESHISLSIPEPDPLPLYIIDFLCYELRQYFVGNSDWITDCFIARNSCKLGNKTRKYSIQFDRYGGGRYGSCAFSGYGFNKE